MPLNPSAPAAPETATDTEVTFRVMDDEEREKPYRVLIQNDDVTPMDFVVLVLLAIFELEPERAFAVMMEAHESGHALVTVLPFQEAHDKIYQAHTEARAIGFPLTFFLEPDF